MRNISYDEKKWRLVPLEFDQEIDDYDEELFSLCRKDDYKGLYKALLGRLREM